MIEEKIPQKILTIGRESDCDVRVNQDDRRTSRHHAQLVLFTDGSVQIVDLNSTNGTFVNGEKILSPTFLEPTDVVRIGSSPALDWKSLVWPDVSPVYQDQDNLIPSDPVDWDEKQSKESAIHHSSHFYEDDLPDESEKEENYEESDSDENIGIDFMDNDEGYVKVPITRQPITDQDSKPRRRSFWQRLKEFFS